MPDTPIYAGHGGLGKPINTVSFIDSPSSVDWLKGGEVILTTAFLYKENTEMQIRFVRKLIDMGVAALGIKIGRYISELPPAVIACANENDFPIFGISYDTIWSEIFTVFHSLRLDKKERNILSTEMITFDKLFRSSSWGKESIQSNFLKCIVVSAVIVDESYNILSRNDGSAMNVLENYCLQRNNYRIEGEFHDSFVPNATQSHRVLDTALYSGERLILCIDENENIRKNELEWITSLYESIRNKNRFMQDASGLWKNFLRECIIGGLEDNFKDYAQVLHFKESQVGTILVFAGGTALQARDEFRCLLRSAVSRKDVLIYDAEIEDEIIVLYAKNGPADEFIFLNELRSILQKVLCQCEDNRIWVGEPTSRMEELKRPYSQARTAQELSDLLMPDEKIVFYRDLSVIERLRESNFDFSEINFLHEQITSFDACKTLEIYLESGNTKRAAECSFIHNNTMRYRIQKLEECLNMDLNKPHNRFNLLLKIKLWHIDREARSK